MKNLFPKNKFTESCPKTYIPTSERKRELVEELILETKKHADFLVISEKYADYYDIKMFVARWVSFIETPREALVLSNRIFVLSMSNRLYSKIYSEYLLPLLLSDKKFIEYFVLGIQEELDNAKTFNEKAQVLNIHFLLSKKVAFQLVESTIIEMIEIMSTSESDNEKHSRFDSLAYLIRGFIEEFPNNKASPKRHEAPRPI